MLSAHRLPVFRQQVEAGDIPMGIVKWEDRYFTFEHLHGGTGNIYFRETTCTELKS